MEINDGSSLANVQVVIDQTIKGFDQLKNEGVGSSFKITGQLVKSPKEGQFYELLWNDNKNHSFTIFGSSPQGDYPLAKKRHSLEYLRDIQHLRPRTNTIGVVTRIRNTIWDATHRFFQDRGFLYIHTPIITSSDCEGAGELFVIKTQEDLNTEKPSISSSFFKSPAFLTVSGQLNVENYWWSLGDVYTFGPTFRAENSHTKRHLSEFWMIEPELAFADLENWMTWAEDYLRFNIQKVLEQNQEDLKFCDKHVSNGLLSYLESLTNSKFERLEYTEAIKLLVEKETKSKTFEITPQWGIDMATEHEKYICDLFKSPVIVYNYPKEIKSFYMRENDDGKTVAAMDVLVPNIGEIIGGSQREERLDKLENRIASSGLSAQDYWWYLDLRKYGSIPHSGFGAGLERLVMMLSGIDNIRDSIPFPRWPGNAKF